MSSLCKHFCTSTLIMIFIASSMMTARAESSTPEEEILLRPGIQYDIVVRLYDALNPSYSEDEPDPFSLLPGLSFQGVYPLYSWLESRAELSILGTLPMIDHPSVSSLRTGIRIHNPDSVRAYLQMSLGLERVKYALLRGIDYDELYYKSYARFTSRVQMGFAVDLTSIVTLDLGVDLTMEGLSLESMTGLGLNLGVLCRF